MQYYLDESGDLGWKFTKPYRHGGSSRYLTIATLCVEKERFNIPRRLIKDVYEKFKWPTRKEYKWVDMSADARIYFAEKAVKMLTSESGNVRYRAIVVNKQRVQSHIRTDSNKLYNYMIGLSLLNEMALHELAELYPDERAVKVASGNSLNDYLQMQLLFEKKVQTTLVTRNSDSSKERNIQFADMLAGVVQSHYEDGNSDPWNILSPVVQVDRLFFP